jgi:hypothetical protein
MTTTDEILALLDTPVEYHYCVSVMGDPDAGEAHDFIVTYDNRWHDTFEDAYAVLWNNEGVSLDMETDDGISWASTWRYRRNPMNNGEREHVQFIIFKIPVEDTDPGYGCPRPVWNRKAI